VSGGNIQTQIPISSSGKNKAVNEYEAENGIINSAVTRISLQVISISLVWPANLTPIYLMQTGNRLFKATKTPRTGKEYGLTI
jgi:hypothetical protein